MKNLTILTILFCLSSTGLRAEDVVKKVATEICLSSYTPKTDSPDELERVYMKVGKSKIFFKDLPRVALTGLKMNETHKLKVYFDERVVASWDITFTSKLNVLNLWRDAGHWQTELSSSTKGCKEEPRE